MDVSSGTTGTTRRPLDRMMRRAPLDDPHASLEDYLWAEGGGMGLLDRFFFAHHAAVCRHFLTPEDFATLAFPDLWHGMPVLWA